MKSEKQLEIDLKRIAQASLFIVAPISVVSLLGWFSGVLIVTRLRADYIPIAPSTALCFSMLSSSLLAYVFRPLSPTRRRLAVFSACLTFVLASAIIIGFFLNISSEAEHLWLNTPLPVGDVHAGHMSPLTAIAFLTGATGALFLVFSSQTRVRFKNSAAFAGIAVSVFGCIVLVGYAHGTPLLVRRHHHTGRAPDCRSFCPFRSRIDSRGRADCPAVQCFFLQARLSAVS